MASIIPLLLAICLTLPFAAGDLSYQVLSAATAPSNCEDGARMELLQAV